MICICDHRTPAGVLTSIRKRGFEVIQLPLDPSLPVPVNGHADLLIFILGGYLLTRRCYYHIAKPQIDRICRTARLKLVLSESEAYPKYPYDCGLCAAVSGRNLIYCEKSADLDLLRLAAARGYLLINVPQGYTKCSCAILADGAIITSDEGIGKNTRKAGIDTLMISPGHVELPGYDHGFIGGTSGLCGNTLYFCGNIEKHPDHAKIIEFAKKHNTDIISLSDEPLYDVGSLMFI